MRTMVGMIFSAGLLLAGCSTVEETFADSVSGAVFANMTGAQVTPGPGDSDAIGRAELSIVDRTDRLCYEMNLTGMSRPTVIALRRGAEGQNGPIVFSLATPRGTSAKDCISPPEALADELRRTPGAFYMEVQTSEFPEGAVRGQLTMSRS